MFYPPWFLLSKLANQKSPALSASVSCLRRKKRRPRGSSINQIHSQRMKRSVRGWGGTNICTKQKLEWYGVTTLKQNWRSKRENTFHWKYKFKQWFKQIHHTKESSDKRGSGNGKLLRLQHFDLFFAPLSTKNSQKYRKIMFPSLSSCVCSIRLILILWRRACCCEEMKIRIIYQSHALGATSNHSMEF